MKLEKQVIEMELKLDAEEAKKELQDIKREYFNPILIQSEIRLAKEVLEAEQDRLSDILGVKVAILNGGFSLIDIC